jgi:Lon protease-like protein
VDVELMLFPLHAVLFPGGRLRLRVFEPRYLRMVSQCLREDVGFGVVTIRGDGSEVGPGADFHELGVRARVSDFDPLKDGMLGITVTADRRIRILSSAVESDGLVMGRVRVLPEDAPCRLPIDYQAAALLLRRLLDQTSANPAASDPCWADAGWVAGRLTELLPLSDGAKQDILLLDDPSQRMDVIFAVLQDQSLL